MERLEACAGRLSDEEMAQAADFINRLDAAKGANTRRVVCSDGSNLSRVRAKAAEVFVAQLLDVPLDLDVYAGWHHDGGVDTIYRGHYVQVKRAGTRTAKRGRPWFKLELNDPGVDAPGWDVGVLVEDDAVDANIFRVAGWLTAAQWLQHKFVLNWYPAPCWAVRDLQPPAALLALLPRDPPRSWCAQPAG